MMTNWIARGLVSALLLGSSVAFAQQGGSVGMDEIDASVSAESGDEMDARAAQEEAIARLRERNEALSGRMDDFERRLKALEDQSKPQ